MTDVQRMFEAKQRMFEVAFGEIINGVTEPTCKRIVGAYKHDVSYSKNMAKINCSAFTYPDLEKCAVALNIVQRDSEEPDAKLFSSKKVVADRIILKIESHFEETCEECEQKYCNKFGDAPASLHCFLCMQGSHNCAPMTEKMEGYTAFAANKPTGFVWLCRGCRLKNDLSDTKKKKEVKFKASEEGEPAEEVAEEKEDKEDDEDRPSPRRDVPIAKDGNGSICPLYKKNQCPHGASGKVKVDGEMCPHPHPRKCLKFCRYGNKRGRGCQEGRTCSEYHPILCKFSARSGECRKRDCTFTHLRHTIRPPAQGKKTSEDYERRRYDGGHRASIQYGANFPPLRSRQRLDSVTSATSFQSDSYRTPFPRPSQRPATKAPPPVPARNSTEDKSGIDFLVKLIENMKSSFENEIRDIRGRLPPIPSVENKIHTLGPSDTLYYHHPQMPMKSNQLPQLLQQQCPLPPAPWNMQYNPNTMY
jgi:hypothetical protein